MPLNPKRAALFLVFAFVSVPSHVSYAHGQNAHAKQKKNAPVNPIVQPAIDAHESKTYNIEAQADKEDGKWVKRGVIANFFVAGLTSVLAIVGFIQAKAAFVNANNVANSERARMVIDIQEWGRTVFPIGFMNIGRLPAGIVFCKGFIEILPTEEDLPKSPSYLRDEATKGAFNWIAAAEHLNVPKPEGAVGADLCVDLSDPQIFDKVKAGGARYFIFARVVYRDGISAKPKETRFCFRVYIDESDNPALEYWGGKSYNMET